MARTPNPTTRRVGPVSIRPRVRNGRTSWRVVWTDAAGQERERTTRTEAEAEVVAAEVCVALNRPGSALQPDVSFQALCAAFLSPKEHAGWRSPATIAKHTSIIRSHLVPALGARRCSTLTATTFNGVLIGLADAGYPRGTIRTVWETLRSVVRFGQSRGVWDAWSKPLDRVGMPHGVAEHKVNEQLDRADVPTAAQVDDLADALARVREEHGLMASVAAGTGLRWGELAGLRVGDIQPNRHVKVRRQVREVRGQQLELDVLPKHGKERTTILPEVLVEPMAEHMHGLDGDDLVFRGPRGGVLRRSSFGRFFRDARSASIYPDHLTWHSLRHFFCVDLLDRGVRPATVAKLAGHHSVRFTLDRYVGADDHYLA